jgi:hypothetical protein
MFAVLLGEIRWKLGVGVATSEEEWRIGTLANKSQLGDPGGRGSSNFPLDSHRLNRQATATNVEEKRTKTNPLLNRHTEVVRNTHTG